MELTYTKVGDYLIPDLMMDGQDAEEELPLGKYGRMRESFLQEHHSGTYTSMLLTGRLDPHLREIEGPEAEKITFFIYEEIAACRRACERLGLGKAEVEKIFYGNCAKLFGLPAQEE